jgi:hypothetical protein
MELRGSAVWQIFMTSARLPINLLLVSVSRSSRRSDLIVADVFSACLVCNAIMQSLLPRTRVGKCSEWGVGINMQHVFSGKNTSSCSCLFRGD